MPVSVKARNPILKIMKKVGPLLSLEAGNKAFSDSRGEDSRFNPKEGFLLEKVGEWC